MADGSSKSIIGGVVAIVMAGLAGLASHVTELSFIDCITVMAFTNTCIIIVRLNHAD